MRIIYKYPVLITDEQTILFHSDPKILCIQEQVDGEFFIWAEVETDDKMVQRKVLVRGTGHGFKGNENAYIGTIQQKKYGLVWHVYDGGNQESNSAIKNN